MNSLSFKNNQHANIITILGHTAGGKTHLAALIANTLGGEIISADSRQVYRGMTIGTGKDYDDYLVDGAAVPYHLIDILDAGEEYSVFEFQKDFLKIFNALTEKGTLPVLCGGSGMYLESVLRQYEMIKVPKNEALREELESKDLTDLSEILRSYRPLHNRTDSDSRKRVVRAIEIADYMKQNKITEPQLPEIRSLTIGVCYDRDERRSRITERLKQRLDDGMISEVQELIEAGITHQKLEYYGLEYKYISMHIRGLLSYEEMFSQLNTAIHRFAKRQMTYFRGMERRGIPIHWIDGNLSLEEKIRAVTELYTANKQNKPIE